MNVRGLLFTYDLVDYYVLVCNLRCVHIKLVLQKLLWKLITSAEGRRLCFTYVCLSVSLSIR